MRKISNLSPFSNLSHCVLRYFVTLKARAMFAPGSRAIKKPYGASLNDKYKKSRKFKHFLQNIRES